MRRLGKHLSVITLALVVGAFLTVCSLATFSHTSEINAGSLAQKGCNTSCTSHGQPAAISSLRDEKDEDDKEPTPPLLYWQQIPINFTALYVAPIVYYLFVHKRKIILLTAQLRF